MSMIPNITSDLDLIPIYWMNVSFFYNVVGQIFIADHFLKLKVFICARINRLHTLMETQASMMIVIDAHFKGSFSFQPTVCCSSYFWFVSSQPRVKLQLDLNSISYFWRDTICHAKQENLRIRGLEENILSKKRGKGGPSENGLGEWI